MSKIEKWRLVLRLLNEAHLAVGDALAVGETEPIHCELTAGLRDVRSRLGTLAAASGCIVACHGLGVAANRFSDRLGQQLQRPALGD